VKRVGVIGAGTMGHGIAHVAAAAGYDVTMFDVSEAALQAGVEKVRGNLEKGVAKGKVSAESRDATLSRLRTTTRLAELGGADLVIEAVPEKLELKIQVLSEVARAAGPDIVLASNTSSLPVSKIAAALPHPARVVGMHFFNPVHLMKLLEIVRADATSEDVLAAVREVALRMGKDPIVVRDSPGFASSRLGIALGMEAIRMLEEGVASAADIDTAMKLGYGHPMGPLELTDLVGLDVRLAIGEYLHRELQAEQFRPPELLRRLVADGKLGKKAGEGFYRY
jgi:3-hydroxybutyryl-CoA dehydrogenase